MQCGSSSSSLVSLAKLAAVSSAILPVAVVPFLVDNVTQLRVSSYLAFTMQMLSGSCHNLLALAEGGGSTPDAANIGGTRNFSRGSLDSSDGLRQQRLIVVCNHLPVRTKGSPGCWDFEWDEDALVAQAKDGITNSDDYEVVYVGSLTVEIDPSEQEKVTSELKRLYNCSPVYLGTELKEKYYKGFCKLQLWPLFHYVLPMSPSSSGRFDADLWQAYVKANKVFTEKVIEESASDTDYVWIHDYHLLVLPSLLRKRFNRIRCGVFLHSPFPSSEIFRTFPKREEILRSLLNSDLIGFHTFDYARHFLSCCSRMLGLEHETSRGSITLDYYGRTVGIKIMPTGVNPRRLLSGFDWPEFKWRRGELTSQYSGKTVLIGVDDMDMFKGIELKLQAFERVLEHHPEFRGNLVLIQITNAPRTSGKDIAELHEYVLNLAQRINRKYGQPNYEPVQYLERHVPLHERMAFYSIADCAVVSATRDGMNLVPYEYVVCRQGPDSDEESKRASMLVVSEFVGCSPSLSGAIRVNPWSIENMADGMYRAIKMPLEHKQLRHDKHWRYVSHHTVAYWAMSYMSELVRVTKNHVTMKCYGLGLGLDTFRMVALDANFRKLEDWTVLSAYQSVSNCRLFLLDYDGTLVSQNSISLAPSEHVLQVLTALAQDPANKMFLFSARTRQEMESWFSSVPSLGLIAENGFYYRAPASLNWEMLLPTADLSWKKMALPILQQYQESTDGSSIETKETALVWHYRDADPDFGNWQAKELLDHLEDVLSNKPVEVVGQQYMVEIKPQGVSKGHCVEKILGGTPMRSARVAAVAASAGAPPPVPTPLIVPEFVLCVGDDRSDEEMFQKAESVLAPVCNAEIFACTVGQKPSKAPFYLNDPADVLKLLSRLVGVMLPADIEHM